MSAIEDDEYEIPLRDQRFFGSGIKRKRIQFVPSSTTHESAQSLPTTPSTSAADKYLSIVFKNAVPAERSSSAPPPDPARDTLEEDISRSVETIIADDEHSENTCELCHRVITSKDSTTRHESSIVHQICAQHSHGPSYVDRRRKGLAVLQSQGWDPDSRKGLGAEGAGILHPIKAKENPGTAGLGARFESMKVVEKPVKLDAGKTRVMEKEGKKKAQKLRDAFYRSEDMEEYLGADGQTNATLDLAAFKRARRR